MRLLKKGCFNVRGPCWCRQSGPSGQALPWPSWMRCWKLSWLVDCRVVSCQGGKLLRNGRWRVGMKFWDVGAIPDWASALRSAEAEIHRSHISTYIEHVITAYHFRPIAVCFTDCGQASDRTTDLDTTHRLFCGGLFLISARLTYSG